VRCLIIIPAFNEELALPGVLEDLARDLPDFDVLVVNDGSSDRTADVARKAGVAVASLPYNLGIGAALQTGFKYAVDEDYDVAVQFDADGQHNSDAVCKLLDCIEEGADLVIGSRFASSASKYDVGTIRLGAMRALRLAVEILSGQRFTDTSSGFRAISRELLTVFARTYPLEYMDSVESLLIASYRGFTVVEVPIEMRQRQAGQPSNRRFKLLYHYVRLFTAMIVTAPLRRRPKGGDA
jgi:glycosyltransferase involved in cell wall biosynthesis